MAQLQTVPPQPKMNLQMVRKVFFGVAAVVVVFVGGYLAGSKGSVPSSLPLPIKVNIDRTTPENQKELDFGLFWKVWDSLNANYYDKSKIVESEMVYGAIKGMVSSLGDPYTIFLSPEENKIVEDDLQGSFEGVGIQIGFKGTRLAVIAPLPGSPGERAGVRAGDLIVGIKDDEKGLDRATDNITLPEAVDAIRGKAGTKVTLVLVRDGVDEPIVVEIAREAIDVPSVVLSYLEGDKIAHIKVLKFSGETKAEWDKAVNDVVGKKNVTGVIVDVRNDPGGYLQGAIDLSSEFLKSGSVVVMEEGKDGKKKELKVSHLGKFINMPTVVLVNKGSASASEIFAGALRDIRQIKLVGEDTFGKGTIQEPITVNGGAGLHITTSRWLTPSGVWVNEKGLVPDIKVEDKTDTKEDEQLQEAINLLKT